MAIVRVQEYSSLPTADNPKKNLVKAKNYTLDTSSDVFQDNTKYVVISGDADFYVKTGSGAAAGDESTELVWAFTYWDMFPSQSGQSLSFVAK